MGHDRLNRFPLRGEVWLTELDPTRGHEIQKTRPAVVIQNDVGNKFAAMTIIAPISSKYVEPLLPVQVLLHAPEGGLDLDSVVMLDQIRAVDKSRLRKRFGRLRASTMANVDQAILISLGIKTSW